MGEEFFPGQNRYVASKSLPGVTFLKLVARTGIEPVFQP